MQQEHFADAFTNVSRVNKQHFEMISRNTQEAQDPVLFIPGTGKRYMAEHIFFPDDGFEKINIVFSQKMMRGTHGGFP
jgi:hypothetical protein